MQTPLQVEAAAGGVRRVTILNNMVTPYTNRLYNELHRRGVCISAVSCTGREASRSWGDNDTPEYRHVVLRGRAFKVGPRRYAHVNFGVHAALAATAPEFLFINGFYPTMLMGAAWAIANRVRMGLITEGWRETMPNSLAHRVIRPLVLSRCEAVVTSGRKGAAYFRQAGIPAHRIFQIPLVPAWDGPAHVPAFEQRPFHLLWVAHFNDEQKNISFFLDVAERLRARLPELRVRMIGNGELQQRAVARLEAAGIAHQLESSVDWRRMTDVYASARVLMLPSRWEPWGLVCDEALQCGVPCIVSEHVGAADDLVVSGVNGLVLPLDAAAWVETCSPLITEPRAWQAYSARALASMEGRGIRQSAAKFMFMLGRL